jgi:predicted RNA polymerase sigma factor
MAQNVPEDLSRTLSRTIETLYRSESGRILATLVRLLGDLDVAEEAMREAFAAALDTWPQAGVPDKPRPWLISTARFKAIDGMRRRARFDSAQKDLAFYLETHIHNQPEEEEIEDTCLNSDTFCSFDVSNPRRENAPAIHAARAALAAASAGTEIAEDEGNTAITPFAL